MDAFALIFTYIVFNWHINENSGRIKYVVSFKLFLALLK